MKTVNIFLHQGAITKQMKLSSMFSSHPCLWASLELPCTGTKLRNIHVKRIRCLATAVWPTFVTLTGCSAYMVLTAMLQRRDGRFGAQLALILKIYSSGAFYAGKVSVQHWTLCLRTYLLNLEVLTLLGKLKVTSKGCSLVITNTTIHVSCCGLLDLCVVTFCWQEIQIVK